MTDTLKKFTLTSSNYKYILSRKFPFSVSDLNKDSVLEDLFNIYPQYVTMFNNLEIFDFSELYPNIKIINKDQKWLNEHMCRPHGKTNKSLDKIGVHETAGTCGLGCLILDYAGGHPLPAKNRKHGYCLENRLPYHFLITKGGKIIKLNKFNEATYTSPFRHRLFSIALVGAFGFDSKAKLDIKFIDGNFYFTVMTNDNITKYNNLLGPYITQMITFLRFIYYIFKEMFGKSIDDRYIKEGSKFFGHRELQQAAHIKHLKECPATVIMNLLHIINEDAYPYFIKNPSKTINAFFYIQNKQIVGASYVTRKEIIFSPQKSELDLADFISIYRKMIGYDK